MSIAAYYRPDWSCSIFIRRKSVSTLEKREMGNKNNDNNLIDPLNIMKKEEICIQPKPKSPCYAGWLKGGVGFLKKMRTRHLPARNIPSELNNCTFLALLLQIRKKKWMVNSTVGKFVQHVLVSVITRFSSFVTRLASNSGINPLFRGRLYLKKVIMWNRLVDNNNYGWFDRLCSGTERAIITIHVVSIRIQLYANRCRVFWPIYWYTA